MCNEIDSMNKTFFFFWNNNMEENTDKRIVHIIAWARYVRHDVKGLGIIKIEDINAAFLVKRG